MFQLFFQHVAMAFAELRSNKLRTFLSLLGITIGVFCIVSIDTVFDSLQNNIQSNMQQLGSNVLYIGKYPWIPEDQGEYQWWKYKARPMCNASEMHAIENNVQSAAYASICYNDEASNLKFGSNEIKGVGVFAVTYEFNKLQPIDINQGRYFSLSEMQGTQSHGAVIGSTVADELFGTSIEPIGKSITILGKEFYIIGVLKKQGKTMTGFDFDGGVIISYNFLASFKNIDNTKGNGFTDPMLMVKAKEGYNLEEMKYEIKSVLRAYRKLNPREPDNFSFNELASIQNSIKDIFKNINLIGFIIGLFSLVVGAFGIANIMFVSVKERTKYIGLKKAIGARKSTILYEFLIESVVLCFLGGLIGMIFVFILAKVLSHVAEFPIIMSVYNFAKGVLISVVIGILSGIIPAINAANMNPVVAIRS